MTNDIIRMLEFHTTLKKKKKISKDAPINTGKEKEITGLEKRISFKHFVSERIYKFQMRVTLGKFKITINITVNQKMEILSLEFCFHSPVDIVF